MIAYELFFFDAQWAWTLSFVWVTAVVVRLARFNIEQGGEAKRSFHGLPSPAAGMALASYYPFSQTPFFETYLFDLPWAQIIGISMVLLSVLMVSHVPYAKVPKIGLRTVKGVTTTVFVLTTVFAAFAFPRYVIFSSFLIYISWGLVKSVLLGLLDRLPGGDPLLDEDEHDMDDRAEVRELAYADFDTVPSDISRSNSILDNALEDQA